MLKLLGILCILGSATGMGQYFVQREKKHIRQLQECKELLLYMRQEIGYAKTPLPVLFERAAAQVSGDLAEFLLKLSKDLTSNAGRSVGALWGKGLEEGGLLFSGDEMEILRQVGAHLGFRDKETQVRMLQLYELRLEKEITERCREWKGKRKVYGSVSVVCGLFVILLLF